MLLVVLTVDASESEGQALLPKVALLLAFARGYEAEGAARQIITRIIPALDRLICIHALIVALSCNAHTCISINASDHVKSV